MTGKGLYPFTVQKQTLFSEIMFHLVVARTGLYEVTLLAIEQTAGTDGQPDNILIDMCMAQAGGVGQLDRVPSCPCLAPPRIAPSLWLRILPLPGFGFFSEGEWLVRVPCFLASLSRPRSFGVVGWGGGEGCWIKFNLEEGRLWHSFLLCSFFVLCSCNGF